MAVVVLCPIATLYLYATSQEMHHKQQKRIINWSRARMGGWATRAQALGTAYGQAGHQNGAGGTSPLPAPWLQSWPVIPLNWNSRKSNVALTSGSVYKQCFLEYTWSLFSLSGCTFCSSNTTTSCTDAGINQITKLWASIFQTQSFCCFWLRTWLSLHKSAPCCLPCSVTRHFGLKQFTAQKRHELSLVILVAG